MVDSENNDAPIRLLDGLRVLDLSRVISGPFCTRMLADLGAEVIKIESPRGDRLRTSPPRRGPYSSAFTQFNAGKKSLCIDLRHDEGRDLVKSLVAKADVFVENFRAGRLAEIGLGYDVLRELNPVIVCCSISGFGQSGEDAGRPAYTDIIQALAGLDHAAANIPEYEGDSPPGVPVSLADTTASLNATIAILAALFRRQMTGEGEWIDLSMFDALVASNDTTLQRSAFTDGAEGVPSIIFRPPFKARDGFFAASVALNVEKTARAMGIPELIEDDRFSTIDAQREHMAEFVDLVRAWAAEKTLPEITATFDRHDVPYGKVQSAEEVVDSALTRDRQMLVDVETESGERLPVLNTPFNFAGGRAVPTGPPPRLGEHNHEILHTLLELDVGEIERLTANGVLISEDTQDPA